MNPKLEEKHLSLFAAQHERLKKMADNCKPKTSMRGLLDMMMDEHEKKGK